MQEHYLAGIMVIANMSAHDTQAATGCGFSAVGMAIGPDRGG